MEIAQKANHGPGYYLKMRLPFFAAVFWSMGIYLGISYPAVALLPYHMGLMVSVLIVIPCVVPWRAVFYCILLILILYSGWVRSSIKYGMQPFDPLNSIEQDTIVTVLGRIKTIETSTGTYTDLVLTNINVRTVPETDYVCSDQDIRLRVYSAWEDTVPHPSIGNLIQVKSALKRKQYCRQDPVTSLDQIRCRTRQRFLMSARNLNGIIILDSRKDRTASLRHYIRKRIRDGYNGIDQEGSDVPALLKAMVLGDRRDISSLMEENFMRCGIYHILAISGLHVGIITGLCHIILRLLHLSIPVACILEISLICGYGWITEPRASVTRAIIMISLYLFARAVDRIPDYYNLLGVAALIILLREPFQLFEPGFQLTFSATWGILAYRRRLESFFLFLKWDRISAYISCSLAAQFTTVILVAYYFNQVSIASIVSTIIILPEFTVFLTLGIFHAVAAIFCGYCECVTTPMVRLSGHIFLYMVNILAKIPYIFHAVPTPSITVLIAWYTGLYFFLCVEWKTAKLRVLLALSALLITIQAPWETCANDSDTLALTIPGMNTGESILLTLPDGKHMLVDGGGSFDTGYDTGKKILVPWLRKRGVDYLDYVVLSHPHPDHMMGLFAVVTFLPVGRFWYGKHEKYIPDFDRLLNMVTETGIPVTCLGSGMSSPEFDPGINNNSLVLKIIYGNISILLTGDIEKETEESLSVYGAQLRATILKAPHHGSTTSNTRGFLDQVHPQIIVISSAHNPYTELPSPEILERYSRLPWSPLVLSTGTHGTISLRSDGKITGIRSSLPIP